MLVEMLGSTDRIYRFYEESVYRYPWIKKFLVLKSPEAWKRVGCAMGAFLELGPRASPATPKVIRMLRDPDRASVAVAALLAIQPQREEDILSLTNVLRITRSSASGSTPEIAHPDGIIALASFGPRAVRARPVLEDCLRSQHPRVRAAAAIALARIGAPADDVVPHVLNELPSVDTPAGPANFGAITPGAIARRQQLVETQQVAIIDLTALGEFGPAARAALPMLTNLKAHPDHAIANAAAEAMAKIKVGTNALSL
jgi:HEAT repeat protein